MKSNKFYLSYVLYVFIINLEQGVNYDKRLVLMDTITFYIAGYDPISHAQWSVLYNIKKNEHVFTKLWQEIQENYHIVDRNNSGEIRNMLDSFEYLPLVISETLRFDNPAYFSLGYQAIKDIEIWDVPISKGSKIFLSLHGIHYNPKQWVEPWKFIPERFDSESEYFIPPANEKSKKTRHPMSFIPFSFGLRSCPGKTLAYLELKSITSHFLSKFDYELDADQKANDFLRFSLRSQFELKLQITKRF